MENLKLGVMGMSEGNGHPYSWSAIFNGYDLDYMKDCPFAVIFDYLSTQEFPKNAIQNASVTHVWTQDRDISSHIAAASRIPNIVDNYADMIGQVDAVLLARDDPENHWEMSKPFIEAGVPVFIDKPLALTVKEAKKIISSEQYPGQVFSCSSLRYAKEFSLSEKDKEELGIIKMIDATIPKSWEKYAVHIIEPVLNLLGNKSKTVSVTNTGTGDVNIVTVKTADNITLVFKVLGKTSCPLSIRIFGTKSYKELVFKDTYYAFKTSLEHFIKGIQEKSIIIPHTETMATIEIIEKGLRFL